MLTYLAKELHFLFWAHADGLLNQHVHAGLGKVQLHC